MFKKLLGLLLVTAFIVPLAACGGGGGEDAGGESPAEESPAEESPAE